MVGRSQTFRRWALIGVLLLLPAGGVRAHVVGDAIQLDFQGTVAPFGTSGDETYTDVWGEGDFGYLGSLGSGVAVLDLDAAGVNPAHVATYAPAGHVDYQDVKVLGGVGYFSGGAGTDVVDLSDPLAPTRLTTIDASLGGHAAARNAAVGGGFAYQVSEDSPQIHVFDVANPAAPAWVRTIDTPDTTGVFDVTLVDDRLYAAGLGGATYVYDVASIGAGAPALAATVPTGANTASAWPTERGDTVLVTHREVGGELAAWDLSTPAAPSLIESVDPSDLGFSSYSTSEVAVVDSLAYVAWHQGGLELIDLDRLHSDGMQRLGFYVIPGASIQEGFTSVRSVYPFLGPEQVLFSDTKRGLYRVDSTVAKQTAPGDYDGDGVIGPIDYAVWRNTYGTDYLAADGNVDGAVSAADYVTWRDALASAAGAPGAHSLPVPAPGGEAALLGAIGPALVPRRPRHRAARRPTRAVMPPYCVFASENN